ncbi:hypothetical protein [Pseudomonas sp. PD9R]|uniref:hypothetical protein n=1 Tax=Pseudomonas sp. PD9R TaxID=2853534 RepID=UPI001C4814D6|nr:hypothetical protein [Pseudomonas sp. PD9R]MBV6821747.1 hypothetical protein [Pseudomonas sp. PD9R]
MTVMRAVSRVTTLIRPFPVGAAAGRDLLIFNDPTTAKKQDQKIAALGSSYMSGTVEFYLLINLKNQLNK